MLYQMLYRPAFDDAQASDFAVSLLLGPRGVSWRAICSDLLRTMARSTL